MWDVSMRGGGGDGGKAGWPMTGARTGAGAVDGAWGGAGPRVKLPRSLDHTVVPASPPAPGRCRRHCRVAGGPAAQARGGCRQPAAGRRVHPQRGGAAPGVGAGAAAGAGAAVPAAQGLPGGARSGLGGGLEVVFVVTGALGLGDAG